MRYMSLTKSERQINKLRLSGRRKVGKMLAENKNMNSDEAKRIVQSEIKKKHNLKDFRL